jgi:CheY-like chemotaxis protein
MPNIRPSVLIIEDDPVIRKLFSKILISNGFATLEAADASAGIALALSESPALILMDIQLPGMDGLTATSVLRSQTPCENVPIIAVTGHVTMDYRQRAAQVGCNDFLSKPITARALLEAIRRALENTPAA